MNWILAKAAALEIQAGALRTAAELLAATAQDRKQATVARTVSQAIAVRQAQRNGHKPAVVEEAPAPERLSKRQKTVARREEKAHQVASILRDHGKPMPIKALREAARERGIDSLTGIIGLVRADTCTRRGRRGRRAIGSCRCRSAQPPARVGVEVRRSRPT